MPLDGGFALGARTRYRYANTRRFSSTVSVTSRLSSCGTTPHIARASFDRAGTEAEDLDLSLVRDGLRRQQAHRRRLAGAVGPEQADAGSLGDLEVEVVYRRQVAEALDDAAEAKGGHPAQGVMRLCAVRYGQPP